MPITEYMVVGTYAKETCREAQNCIARGISYDLANDVLIAAVQSGEWWGCSIIEDKDPDDEAAPKHPSDEST